MRGRRLSITHDARRRDRLGFSLIEVLVVMGVIGVLVVIAFPVVQSARESARQTQCRNHLRQIGLALQNHQEQFGLLPQDGFNGYGYGVFLLPQLEQSPLYGKVDPLTTTLANPSSAAADVEDVILTVFRCPTDKGANRLDPSQFGRSNYLGTEDLFSEATDLAHVLDGESLTFAVGETITDHAWALPGTGACNGPPNGSSRFGSSHSGGAHFVMCDTSVRFISNGIDLGTFQALCTPQGNEPVGDF